MAQHDGPCLNYEGQKPEDYDEYDSCYLHLEAATAGRMVSFAAESIVRDLATSREPSAVYQGIPECALCDGVLDGPTANGHAPECPWRRAREWVDANPPRVTPGFRL